MLSHVVWGNHVKSNSVRTVCPSFCVARARLQQLSLSNFISFFIKCWSSSRGLRKYGGLILVVLTFRASV